MYTKCIPHIDKFFYTFSMQNRKNYARYARTNFVYKMWVKMWGTFCIQTFCIHFVYLNSDLQKVYITNIYIQIHTECMKK